MKSIFSDRNRIISLIAVAAGFLGCYSCVKVDATLGSDLIATNQLYDTYVAEYPLEEIQVQTADSLSGYSQKRMTIGAIRDEHGVTSRACAFPLIPFYDTLDFGTNAKFKSFHMIVSCDTISINDESQRNILQNINVYELEEDITDIYDVNAKVKHGTKRITTSTPVYRGQDDTVGFYFTKEFGEKYMKILQSDLDSITHYVAKFPGIYMETDEPVGEGGRINMFKCQLQYNSSSYYVDGNYAQLNFTSTYDGVEKDTSFFFLFGADDFLDVDSLVYNAVSTFPQYVLNMSQETGDRTCSAGETMRVEGGGGLKPVISAKEIRSIMRDEISKHGDPDIAIINKATIVLPFEFPDDYTYMRQYPQILSPTCRLRDSDGNIYSYVNLTDASSSDEDQGDINRSLKIYSPDITYHAQSIISMDPESKYFSNYDIWMLILANETVQSNDSSDGTSSSLSDYYTQLMYAQYYNNMMYGGYGYGGYSSYGSYGSYGSNYYNYYLMNQLYSSMYSSSSSSTEESESQLDIYRYYDATLCGPEYPDESRRPTLRFTYSLPRAQ